MSSTDNLPFIVAGGGIGGLCAGLALARKGLPVKVLERAPEIGEIGYGIQIAPNGHAILKKLGVMEILEPQVFYPDALILVDAVDLKEVSRIQLKDRFVERYKYPYFVVHRRDLHAALVETCRREPNFSFEEGEVDSYENRDGYVEVNCSDGRTLQGRAMIGCEGLRSKTRARIVGDTPRSTGYVVYRGLVPVEEISNKDYLNSMIIYGGPGCHIVQYRLRGGTVMNNVATFQSPAYARGEADYGGVDEFKAAYDQCAPEVRDMLKYFALDKNWLLHDVQPATNWTDGNVTLLGDSAHATLQYLAQGAIMSMEDALVLAHEVAQQPDDVNAAFMSYQGQRLNRTARVITTARLFGAIVHAREGERLLRNELARSRDVDIPWEVDWLYQGANLLDKID
ncbi:MAG TPA: hypothetical protein DEB15_04365 [Pusillimonas sp.]|jgi:salicylate hydroxylase|nr:hypothetical protein [Pusillimonas sp.]MBC42163.1 hypothetical protein [Pusillimonas sp.]HBT32110.1 hypothetical protein [Pusillimonas sp.]HCN70510.1 hypothetical protein [Pusillimonas sp.]HCP77200.1 hypothetical protein [Pusillimonas sp.]|tara:strand:+ start:50996 stop:52186 length:1191 start_codon:yes stop_codon:yes gene_type:complete